MMVKVLCGFKVHSFESYSEALDFQTKNGGTIYIKCYGQEGD